MAIELSQRLQQIQPSPTLALNQKANELKQQGAPVINLTVGEPDFNTPEFIRQAAVQAISEGYSHYPPVGGFASLKEAICQKFENDNGLSYEPQQILVSTGAKQSLYNAFMALLNPNDEVLIPAPYWVSYPDAVKLTGAKPVIMKTTMDENFKITPQMLRNHISDNSRMLIVNSPSNPSGMIYSEDELKELAEIMIEYPRLTIVSDDIYEHLCWGQKFNNVVNVAPMLKHQTIVVNGMSKAYAMTGWRIGYAAGPEEIIQGMQKLQSQSTSGANAVAQKAAEAALKGDQKCVEDMRDQFKRRHDMVIDSLQELKHIQVQPAEGTFYSFFNVERAMEAYGFTDDTELAQDLLEKANVALVPGSAFGTPGHMRLSFAADEMTLTEALSRLKQYGL